MSFFFPIKSRLAPRSTNRYTQRVPEALSRGVNRLESKSDSTPSTTQVVNHFHRCQPSLSQSEMSPGTSNYEICARYIKLSYLDDYSEP
jgi:murein L,D-transpeptidase YafK